MAMSHSKAAAMGKVTTPNQSLHELIIQHPKLSDHPLRWTARHLELLHCTFQQIDIPLEAKTGAHEECTVKDATGLANNPWFGDFERKASCFRNLFNGERGRLVNYCTEPTFYFNGHVKHRPHCPIYYLEPTYEKEDENKENKGHEDGEQELRKTGNPVIGFFAYSSITQRRAERCYPKQYRSRPNGDAQQLWDRMVRECTPETWFEDPYLVCIITSLAQCQWRDNQLDTPVSRTEATWPTIYYTKIPFEPYGTFHDRMEKALLDAKVGTSAEGDETGCKSVNPNATAEVSDIRHSLGMIELSTTNKGLM
ncbi:hypothetical protein EDB82DRAFT_482351, partial [Fusarium venenatum]|uniref:uncharacterized protein n=1 Tax=Fusarium venenatum TaxID=56646 RepID=UPI001DB29618